MGKNRRLSPEELDRINGIAITLTQRALKTKTPIDLKSKEARFMDSRMRRFTVNGIAYGGYGGRNEYFAKEHLYLGHHGIREMDERQLLEYTNKLAKKVPQKEDKRGKRRAKPLTPLELSVLLDAKKQLAEMGRVLYNPLRNTGRNLSNAEVAEILAKLRKKGLLDKKTFFRSKKPALREVDETHPFYKDNILTAYKKADYFARKNPGIPRGVLHGIAEGIVLRAAQIYDEKEYPDFSSYLGRALSRAMVRASKNELMKDTDSMDAALLPNSRLTLHDTLHNSEHEGIIKGIELEESLKNLLNLHKEKKMSENHVLVKLLRSDAYRVPLEDIGNILKLSAERVRKIEKEAKEIIERQKKIAALEENPKQFYEDRKGAEIN